MKINENDVIVNEEENIYQKLAQAIARAVDINLGKTTLADLLDGYTRYIQLKSILTELEEWLKDMITPKPVQGGGIGFVQNIKPEVVLEFIQELKEKYSVGDKE